MKEELIEEGIVISAENGTAIIDLLMNESCEDCSAKIYCSPSGSKKRSLTVRDPFGVKPGDSVRISVGGSKLLAASFFLYGFPLLLLIAGIMFGINYFDSNKELLSSLLGASMLAAYYLAVIIYSKLKKQTDYSMPEIITVKFDMEE